MTTSAADNARPYELGDRNNIGIIAADIIYEGSAVGENGSGYARPLVAGDPFIGFAAAKVDNAAGAAGDKNVELITRGRVELPLTSPAITDVGAAVYASDDATFTLTQGANSFIGRIVRVSSAVAAGKAIVAFDAAGKGILGGGVAELTDGSTGSASDTLAAMTATDTLTDSTGGTADDTVADVSTVVTGVDGTGSNAASKADVDTRLGTINDNFKELTDQAITQVAFNTATVNAIASLAAKVNALLRMAE